MPSKPIDLPRLDPPDALLLLRTLHPQKYRAFGVLLELSVAAAWAELAAEDRRDCIERFDKNKAEAVRSYQSVSAAPHVWRCDDPAITHRAPKRGA